ncbi:MAG TPA: PEP-CTERM sorting domain-containing protein [Candidatus Sulfotelmatobacter sp.]|nr:PEP-CTERM sorting domain-containing protein [Candidatus Sulfotelmatobacter sp.]
MRMFLAGLTLVLLSLSWASPASANGTEVLVNGGFETGDFTGWTISGNTANPGGFYYGVDAFDAYTGNFGAYMSQDAIDGGEAPVILSQNFTAAPGETLEISFALNDDEGAVLGENHFFEAALNGVPLISFNDVAPGYTVYSFAFDASQTSNTISFAFVNDDSFWSFDDASVQVPEPSALLMLAGAVPGLFFLRRRRAA